MPSTASALTSSCLSTSHTPVLLSECFPKDDVPVRSTDCVAWGPHNVLLLATRWRVAFFAMSLVTPAGVAVPRHHPLCYRREQQSAELVVGAKWSSVVVPEVRYPAEARVCVQTTGNLIVYRVARSGGGSRASVSKGVGIGINYYPNDVNAAAEVLLSLPPDEAAEYAAQHEDDDDDEENDVDEKQSKLLSPAEDAARNGTADKRTPVSAPRRHGKAVRGPHSESDSESVSEALKTTSSSSAPSPAGGKRVREKPPARQSTRATASAPVPKTKANRTRSSSASTSASKKSKTCNNSSKPSVKLAGEGGVTESDGASRQPSGGTRHCHSVIDYFWLPNDVLLVITTTGLHFVRLYGDFSDDETPQLRPLPSAGYCFSEDWVGGAGCHPSCAALVHASRNRDRSQHGAAVSAETTLVLVASPLAFRLFAITQDTVRLLHCIDVPMLSAIPSCVCGVLERQSEEMEASHQRRLTVFIAAPAVVLSGSVLLEGPPGRQDGREDASKPPSPSSAVWEPLSVQNSVLFRDEPFLRGFHVFSTESIQDERGRAAVGEFIVLGVGRRCLKGMLLRSGQAVTLFRCPSLAASTSIALDAAVAVCGVAVHPSCTLGLLVLQTGRPLHDPLHVMPVVASEPEGFLRRMLSLHDVVRESDLHAARDVNHKGGLASAGGNSRAAFLWQLWRQQRDSGSALWERPLQLTHGCAPLTEHQEAWRQFVRAPTADSALQSSVSAIEGDDLRHRFLAMREEAGVSLYLRDAGAQAESATAQIWKGLLQGLWRRCPWEATPLYEIALANALGVLARRSRFAGLQLTSGESFWEETGAISAATSPWMYSFNGARDYVLLYLAAQEKGIAKLQDPSVAGPRQLYESSIEARDCTKRMPPLALWDCAASWVSALRSFLKSCGVECPQNDVSTVTTSLLHRFPCSVCDAADVSQICGLSFSHVSSHTPSTRVAVMQSGGGERILKKEAHTTAFSPRTFCPLAMLSSDGVLTRCQNCGLNDFASGPCCSVCGDFFL